MNKIITGIQMELKSLRIYKWQVVTSLVILPFSYVFVILLFGNIQRNDISYLLSGYMIASLIGSFVGLFAIRICNLLQPEVLELYATLFITIPQTVLSLSLTYMLISMPGIILSAVLLVIYGKLANLLLFIIGIVISVLAILLLGIFLGLLIRNMFKAQGIIPLLSWALLLIAPVYYKIQNLNLLYKVILLINPVTHMLNILRISLGFPEIVSIKWSFLYLSVLIIAIFIYSIKAFKRFYILEKFY